MKKLILDVDALKVETFETDENTLPPGTVVGLQIQTQPKLINDTDEPFTYGAGSCNGGVCTNDYSCEDSWAMGCQSDPMNGWSTPDYGC